MITAHILATGDEIRTGNLVDSNSAWLAEKLEDAGVRVALHSSVGDDLREITAALQDMGAKADIGLVTGGLGPTSDDLTAQAAALAGRTLLEENREALEHVQGFFQRLGREMPRSNRKQALLPAGSAMIPNPLGTAPGFSMRIGGCLGFFLPGVPSEMKRMFQDTVLPDLRERFRGSLDHRLVRTISTFGLTESGTADQLEPLIPECPGVTFGYRTSFPVIQVKLYASGRDRDELDKRLGSAVLRVREVLGEHIFSESQEPMAEVLGNLLRDRGATLALAESCTGGLISHMITSVPGSSDTFRLGAVTYDNLSKVELIGVSTQTLQHYGAVSEQTAAEMALGVREAAESDYGLSTTGIAGPSGGSEDKPVGTVCIGLAGPHGVQSKRFTFRFRSRSRNMQIFAMTGLDWLRRVLLEL
jgi:nicotinamide-nucleotide amidase